MRIHALSRSHELEGTPDEVFPFFADAFALESITPDFLGFEVITPAPIESVTGTVIQYAMRLHGLPVHWTSVIQRWDPPHVFADVQLRGPYRLWHHTHRFEALPGGRTLMRDDVRYALPLQPVGELALPFVRRDLDRIFDYRRDVLPERLAAFRAGPPQPRATSRGR
ncbi:MAG: SRPBCC family protein [Solirubrobacteraceae bacterium]|nr:SRPBCC family protein [Patulibacter sp.]